MASASKINSGALHPIACAFLAALSMVVGGCVDTLQWEDVGALCAWGQEMENSDPESDSEYYSFEVGKPLSVSVHLGDGNGCDKYPEASCDVVLRDNIIEVRAVGSIERPKSTRNACPAARIPVVAHCSTPNLSAGTYEIRYGERTPKTIEIPSVGKSVHLGSDVYCSDEVEAFAPAAE